MIDENLKIVSLANKITSRIKTELSEAAAGGKKRKFARFRIGGTE
jgi:hypothetical protein